MGVAARARRVSASLPLRLSVTQAPRARPHQGGPNERRARVSARPTHICLGAPGPRLHYEQTMARRGGPGPTASQMHRSGWLHH